MRVESGFLSTRVGRRTLLHFLGAALLPVLVSSLVGIWYVRQSLEAESVERVRQTAKTVVSLVLRDLLQAKAATLSAAPGALSSVSSPWTDHAQAEHLRTDSVLLRLMPPSDQSARDLDLQFVRSLPDGRLAAMHVPSRRLWAGLDELVDFERTSLCVFDRHSGQRVHCSASISEQTESALRTVALSTEEDPQGAGASLLVARRSVFLQYELGAGEWRLVTAESRAEALASASAVTNSLFLLMTLAMISAFTFAHRQIRRSTEPLSALRDATRRVAGGDLQSLVRIGTDDEYGELGRAFNGMTSALSRQLQLLHRMDDVDDATLRERRVGAIAKSALNGLQEAPTCHYAAIAIIEDHDDTRMTQWLVDPGSSAYREETVVITERQRDELIQHPRLYVGTSGAPDAPAASTDAGVTATIRCVFPLMHDGELLGAATIGISPHAPDQSDITSAARRLADRVALGVANVRLLTKLEALSSGTLLAFARAIDANSPWTAGHSERVTHLALRLGRQLSLSRRELSTLYRGGLMHDIGKIGIPPEVLDKPSRLTDAERALIERHPAIGERILKPIPAFADALPIVRSHHERVDGTGYPDQLAGDAIPWLARILAVADVYDALVSDRPYRTGLSPRAAITMIEQQAGTHFDRRVVEALRTIEHAADGLEALDVNPFDVSTLHLSAEHSDGEAGTPFDASSPATPSRTVALG